MQIKSFVAKNPVKLIVLLVILAALSFFIFYDFDKSYSEDTLYDKTNQSEYIDQETYQQNNTSVQNTPSITTPIQQTQEESPENEPPLLLMNIGINFDFYNPSTGNAGDFVFTKQQLQFSSVFMDYGFVIPATSSASGQAKANPQPTFILPLGTKVLSLVDGVVVGVPKLYSGDYSIQVAKSPQSKWRYETEHVLNPLVKEGDIVKAGQVIAEVSTHGSQHTPGFGMFEIGILHGGIEEPEHVCPFAYLDPSVKEDILKKITAFYKSWEEYRGDTKIYDESKYIQPGCLTFEPIKG